MREGAAPRSVPPLPQAQASDRSVHGSCAYRRRHDGGDGDAYECESWVVREVAHRPDRMGWAASRPKAPANVRVASCVHNAPLAFHLPPVALMMK